MIFYHGNPSPKKMRIIRDICPQIFHRAEYTPSSIRDSGEKFFLDNGAFTQDFDREEWVNSLDWIFKEGLKPDFVVLPDEFDNPDMTHKKHLRHVSEVRERGFDYYYVVQKGSNRKDILDKALDIGAEGLFIGGSWHKPRVVPDFVELAHKNDLKVHVGMPKDFFWVVNSDVDSFDSSNIVRNQAWDKLRRLSNKMNNQKFITNY